MRAPVLSHNSRCRSLLATRHALLLVLIHPPFPPTRVGLICALSEGCRAIDVDCAQGSGASRYECDVLQHEALSYPHGGRRDERDKE